MKDINSKNNKMSAELELYELNNFDILNVIGGDKLSILISDNSNNSVTIRHTTETISIQGDYSIMS